MPSVAVDGWHGGNTLCGDGLPRDLKRPKRRFFGIDHVAISHVACAVAGSGSALDASYPIGVVTLRAFAESRMLPFNMTCAVAAMSLSPGARARARAHSVLLCS